MRGAIRNRKRLAARAENNDQENPDGDVGINAEVETCVRKRKRGSGKRTENQPERSGSLNCGFRAEKRGPIERRH